MRPPARRVLVTGAAGYIGRTLVAAMLTDRSFARAHIVLLDRQAVATADSRVDAIAGDLSDADALAAAVGDGVDLVYHLAAVVGGAAEADYALARRVNIDATLSLFERLRETGRCPRVVYASSIAVFGEPPPACIDDATEPRPTMTYGAQKRMMEIALAQFSARGWLDGLSLRLPAIVAKPIAPGTPAVFINGMFHVFARGGDMTIPVSPDGTIWLLSTGACVDALLHAGRLSADDIGDKRALTLPALRVRIGDLLEVLERHYPAAARITFVPEARIQAQFASQPPLSTEAAVLLGFRHDGDLDRLVKRALA